MPRVLILKTGTTDPGVVALHGDYDDWFVRALSPVAECAVVPVWEGQPLPETSGHDGLLITGSPLSVRDEAPWMAALGRWCLAKAEAGAPVLGVCFGHQLLGEVLGGRVEQNPEGLEVGTVEVGLTDEGAVDPLFRGLPRQLSVQATHRDILVTPPPGCTRLATNANTSWQAFGLGERVRCVQFHPELPADAIAALMTSRGQTGLALPTPHGPAILRNWVAEWLS
jgi:GMP synthase (glutamine-hydrolysing)